MFSEGHAEESWRQRCRSSRTPDGFVEGHTTASAIPSVVLRFRRVLLWRREIVADQPAHEA
jgi:hypothetical protein